MEKEMEKEMGEKKTIKGTSVSIISSWAETLSRIIPIGTLNKIEAIDLKLSPGEMAIFDQLKEVFPHRMTDYRKGNVIPYNYLKELKENLSAIKKIVEPFL
jgi:hypothetical protein